MQDTYLPFYHLESPVWKYFHIKFYICRPLGLSCCITFQITSFRQESMIQLGFFVSTLVFVTFHPIFNLLCLIMLNLDWFPFHEAYRFYESCQWKRCYEQVKIFKLQHTYPFPLHTHAHTHSYMHPKPGISYSSQCRQISPIKAVNMFQVSFSHLSHVSQLNK